MHGQRKIFKTFVVPSLLPIMEVKLSLQLSSVVKFHLDLFQLFLQNAHVFYAKTIYQISKLHFDTSTRRNCSRLSLGPAASIEDRIGSLLDGPLHFLRLLYICPLHERGMVQASISKLVSWLDYPALLCSFLFFCSLLKVETQHACSHCNIEYDQERCQDR